MDAREIMLTNEAELVPCQATAAFAAPQKLPETIATRSFPTGWGQHDTHAITRKDGTPNPSEDAGKPYSVITPQQIVAMVRNPPAPVEKERAQWFIPSRYVDHDARSHEAQRERGVFSWLALDVDQNNLSLAEVKQALADVVGDCSALIYSTSSATEDNRKWRALVPLKDDLPGADYPDTAEAFFDLLETATEGVLICDRALQRPGQLIYLPNPRSGFYQSEVVQLDRLNLHPAHPIMVQRQKNRDKRETAKKEAQERQAQRRKQAPIDLGHNSSPVDAFNAAHDVEGLLERYGYARAGRSNDWRSPMQTSGSYATTCFGDYWVSLSASDAVANLGQASKSGARFGDAFDLFCHFEHGGDFSKAVAAYGAEIRQSAPPSIGHDAGWTPQADQADTECPPPLPDEAYRGESAPPKADSDPVDLWGSFAPPELPQGLLPRVLEDFARLNGEQMGADPAGLVMAALVTCAAAIPDRIKIKVKRHAEWTESARLWAALVGPPSAKKSPIISAATAPLCRIDSQMMRDWQRQMNEWTNTPKDERTGPAPAQRRLRIEDTTVEAAQQVLEGSPDGVLCLQDELSGFFGAMDKYNGGKGASADRAFWLRSFNGGEYALNRIGRGAGIIDNLSVSMLGGIQPEPLRKIAGDSVDDGLLQRLFPILLRPASIGRDEPLPPVNDRYRALIEALHRLTGPGWMGLGVLEFSTEAQAIRRDLEERHLRLQAVETINRKLASHIGKYDGLFARLCVVWHCVEHVEATQLSNSPAGDAAEMRITVDANTARRVSDFLHRFLLRHAFAFYSGTLGLSDDHDRLTSIAGYILTHKKTVMTNRDVQRGDRLMRGLTDREIRPLFEQLATLGWLEMEPNPRPTLPPRWRVTPAVHVKFADRMQTEAQRRTAAKEAVAWSLGERGQENAA